MPYEAPYALVCGQSTRSTDCREAGSRMLYRCVSRLDGRTGLRKPRRAFSRIWLPDRVTVRARSDLSVAPSDFGFSERNPSRRSHSLMKKTRFLSPKP